MSIKSQRKVPRAPVATIVANRRRRSRSEGTLTHMTITSYPHRVIGNVVNVLYGGDEASVRSALSHEGRLELLEFIRSLRFTTKDNSLVFSVDTVVLDPKDSKARALAKIPSEKLSYRNDDGRCLQVLKNDGGLARELVELFHFTQVRGMTRKFELNTDNWSTTVSKIVINPEVKSFNGLQYDNHIEPVSLDTVISMVQQALTFDKGELIFGSDGIIITMDTSVTQVNYTIPASK